MTNRITQICGSLVVLALALLLAAVNFLSVAVSLPIVLAVALGVVAFFHRYEVRWTGPRFRWKDFLASELGVVSVLYFVEGSAVAINGSTTPPTGQQAAQVFKQIAQVVMADADTQALFTHNWNLGASAPTYFNPEIFYYQQLNTAGGTWLTGLTFDVTNTNVVKVNKLNFLGTGGTFIVTLRRPHSVGQ